MDIISICMLLFLGIPSHITYGTYRQLQSELQPSRGWMTSVSSLMTDVAELEDMGKYMFIQFIFTKYLSNPQSCNVEHIKISTPPPPLHGINDQAWPDFVSFFHPFESLPHFQRYFGL